MAFIHGKGAYVSVNSKDLSTYTTNIEFSEEPDVHDVTTLGKSSKVYMSGLKDATCTIEGIYDNTASNSPAPVLKPLVGGAAVKLVYRPEGTGSAKPEREVDVIVSSYVETAPVADMITWSCELQCSDAIDDAPQGGE